MIPWKYAKNRAYAPTPNIYAPTQKKLHIELYICKKRKICTLTRVGFRGSAGCSYRRYATNMQNMGGCILSIYCIYCIFGIYMQNMQHFCKYLRFIAMRASLHIWLGTIQLHSGCSVPSFWLGFRRRIHTSSTGRWWSERAMWRTVETSFTSAKGESYYKIYSRDIRVSHLRQNPSKKQLTYSNALEM